MVEWMKGFFIPIIELVFIGGIIIFFAVIFYRAWHKVYSNNLKWFLKYKVFRNKYNPDTVKWVLDAMEKQIDYWTAKKFLMLNDVKMEQVNETMWIYDVIVNELKGGMNKDGQRIAGSNRKTEPSKTPNLPSGITGLKTY